VTDVAIQVEHVWKKFRKGELHDSLRELIPAIGRRLIGRSGRDQLHDREFWALRDVSFEVKRGESLGIIGPNGAGKSTMLKLLSRIIRPNRGSYRVNGRLSALIEVGSGFHQDLSGRENIYLNGIILGMKRAEIRAKEEAIIDFAGVDDFIDTPVKRYSSGMKARLGFAVAAHMEPDVLLVDEVLSVGDAKFRAKCIRHMQDLIRGSTTVVFISHILDQVRSLCPNSLVLSKGEGIYHGPTEGAIKVYLDALGEEDRGKESASDKALLRNVRLIDADGRETLEWKLGQPGVMEFDLVVRQPMGRPVINISFSTVGGIYLCSALSRGFDVPGEPGTYRVRFIFDPMPLADGDYTIDTRIFNTDDHGCVGGGRMHRTVSVRGGRTFGQLIECNGQWELLEKPVVTPASPAGPNAQNQG
jgi:lipopolysaccharide transport system ATP-binding protein